MEGGESKTLALQEQSPIGPEMSARFAENTEGFQQCVKEVFQAIEQDQSFSQMTTATYDRKKSYLTGNLQELSRMHRLLADQHSRLLREVTKNCPSLIKKLHPGSSDLSAHQVAQRLKPNQVSHTHSIMKPSKYVSLFLPDRGGFYLSEKEGSSDSGLEPFKSINKLPAPAVNNDALKVKETNPSENLLEKISSLEEEVVSLNKILQSLRDENAELKQEIKENVSDISLYTSESNLKIKTIEQELAESKEHNDNIKYMAAGIIYQKASDKIMYEDQIEELNKQISEYLSVITELKSKNEARENVRNAVINRLKDELQVKCESVAGLQKTIDTLEAEKCSQYDLVQELHARVNALQFQNVGALPSFDNVQKLINELKLKVEELEREVDKQKKVMSDGT